MVDKFIYETAIYHGGLKEWHVLNLNSGTFYAKPYETQEEALASIEDGTVRSDRVVKALPIMSLRQKLANINLGKM